LFFFANSFRGKKRSLINPYTLSLFCESGGVAQGGGPKAD
jgi:hypothetical protein